MQDKSRVMIKRARYLSQVAHNMERIASQTAHICEWVVFTTTGDMVGFQTDP